MRGQPISSRVHTGCVTRCVQGRQWAKAEDLSPGCNEWTQRRRLASLTPPPPSRGRTPGADPEATPHTTPGFTCQKQRTPPQTGEARGALPMWVEGWPPSFTVGRWPLDPLLVSPPDRRSHRLGSEQQSSPQPPSPETRPGLREAESTDGQSSVSTTFLSGWWGLSVWVKGCLGCWTWWSPSLLKGCVTRPWMAWTARLVEE